MLTCDQIAVAYLLVRTVFRELYLIRFALSSPDDTQSHRTLLAGLSSTQRPFNDERLSGGYEEDHQNDSLPHCVGLLQSFCAFIWTVFIIFHDVFISGIYISDAREQNTYIRTHRPTHRERKRKRVKSSLQCATEIINSIDWLSER